MAIQFSGANSLAQANDRANYLYAPAKTYADDQQTANTLAGQQNALAGQTTSNALAALKLKTDTQNDADQQAYKNSLPGALGATGSVADVIRANPEAGMKLASQLRDKSYSETALSLGRIAQLPPEQQQAAYTAAKQALAQSNPTHAADFAQLPQQFDPALTGQLVSHSLSQLSPDVAKPLIDQLIPKAKGPTDLEQNLTNPVTAQYLNQETKAKQDQAKATLAEQHDYHQSVIANERDRIKNSAAQFQAGVMPPETVTATAQQALAGDASALRNLGRTGVNATLVRTEMTRLMNEQHLNGADIAAKNAEFSGFMAGQRTIGTKGANADIASTEAGSLIPLARTASDAVVRSGFLPFGNVQVMFDDKTNNPALRQFAVANNGLSVAYAKALNPTGVATVDAIKHGRDLLSLAHDQASYNKTLDQMEKEIAIAKASPGKAAADLHDRFIGNQNAQPAAGSTVPANGRPPLSSFGG